MNKVVKIIGIVALVVVSFSIAIPISYHMFFCGCDMGQDLNRPIQTNNMIAPGLVFSGSIFTLQVYNLQVNQSYSLWFPATNYNQDFLFRENPTTQFITVPYVTSQNHGLLTIYLQQNQRNIDTILIPIIDTSQ